MKIVKRMSLIWSATALLALGAVQPSVQATAAELKPVAVVSFAGYDALKKDIGFVGELAGMPELAQAAEGFLAIVTRAQGLAGLDKAKPIGAAVFLGEDSKPSGYLFIPVEDVDKLLDVLQDVVTDVEDQGEGYSTFKTKRGPTLTMRETKGWVFVSLSKEMLAGTPADPTTLLGNLAKDYDVAVKLNIGNVPEPLMQFAIAQIRAGAEQAMKKSVQDDPAAEEFRKAFVESSIESQTQAILDLDSFTLGLAIDDKTRSAYLDMQVDMKDDSKLAKQLNGAADEAKPTLLPGLADAARVFNLHFNAPVAGDEVKMSIKMIEDSRKLVDKKIEDEVSDEEAQKVLKKMANEVIDVAVATIEGGQINGGAVVTGDGPFSVVLGMHVADGKKLEKVAKQAIELGEKDPNFPEVEVDADTKSGITYHTLAIPEGDDEEAAENLEKFFGTDELTVALGFGKKTIVIAIGDDPIEAADSVVNAKPKSLPAKTVPFQLELKVGPIMKMAAEQENDNQPIVKVMADSLAESKNDHINLVASLIKNGEKVRFEIEEGIIAAFGKAVVAASRKGGR